MKKGRFRSPAISYFAATKNEGCGHDHRTEHAAVGCAIRWNARSDERIEVFKRTVERVFPRRMP